MPISADPAPDMTDFTSAKSRLMRPGVVINDVMPSTPWNSTWSAMRKASTIGMFGSATWSSRSFGTTISVSTAFFSSVMPRSAWVARLRPSNPNGRVTTPIVSAPSPRAISATTGAPPVPGAAAFARGDEDHVGALEDLLDLVGVLRRRRSGRPRDRSPAPSPRVVSRPMSSFTSASDISSVWASVLTAMNSTPRRPASIIRFTAFTPPPPMPTTLITAR